MFVFLIALKSRNASQDWQLTTKLLSQTLESIQNQTNSNYKIVVVCNEKLAIPSNVDWVLTDNASPDLNADFHLKEKDRAKRLLIGYEYAKKYNPDYLMPVDADDFVSQHITEYALNDNNKSNGWYLDSGYIYEHNNQLIHIDNGFKDYCGSSLIINTCKFLDYFDGDIYLHNQSNNLIPLPFDGVIYNRCNGDNFAATKPLKESMGRADPKFMYESINENILRAFNFKV